MNAVFLMLRCWNLPVLFGTLLGTAGAVLNFFLMAQTVSRSVTLQQDEVKRKVRFSHSLRTLLLLYLLLLQLLLLALLHLLQLFLLLMLLTVMQIIHTLIQVFQALL